jgi:hypothetical protein
MSSPQVSEFPAEPVIMTGCFISLLGNKAKQALSSLAGRQQHFLDIFESGL